MRRGNAGTASYFLPPTEIPSGQPARPNTAVQYPVFNPEFPKLQPSPSPLHAQRWRNLLHYYPGDLGPILAGILTYGAQIGYRGKKHSCHSANHYIHEPSIITGKLAEDLDLRRVRLTSKPSFISPLGLVSKHDGGWRRIHDLSWPPGRGVNQGIPDNWSAIEYMKIDDIYDQIIKAGPGCTIIKRDIKDAFRIVPIAEDNQHLLAFSGTTPPTSNAASLLAWQQLHFSLTSSQRLSIGYSSASFPHFTSTTT